MTQEQQQYPQPQQPPATYYQQPPPAAAHANYGPPPVARPGAGAPNATGGIWTLFGIACAGLFVLIGFIGALASDGKFGMICSSLLNSGMLMLTVVLLAEILATGIKARLNK